MIYVAAAMVAVFVVVYREALVYYRRRARFVAPTAAVVEPAVAPEPAYDLDRAERLLAGYRLQQTIDSATYAYCMAKLANADAAAHPLQIPSAWTS